MVETTNITTLKRIAKELKIPRYTKYNNDTKSDLLELIKKSISPQTLNIEIAKHSSQIKIINGWKQISKLGTGKHGSVYKVIGEFGEIGAMKVFKGDKKKINKEIHYHKLAYPISPSLLEVNVKEGYMVMELLDKSLLTLITEQKGLLTISQQKSIINLYITLDKLNIFHNDANPANIMVKNEKFYLIDYGYSCSTSHEKIKNVRNPNVQYGIVGLLTMLRHLNYDILKFDQFVKTIPSRVKNKLLHK